MACVETPFLDGRLTIWQPKAGFRFSADALWLAHFVLQETTQRGTFVELGVGSGIVSTLLLSAGFSAGEGVEIDPEMVQCATATFQANGLESHYGLVEGDLCRISKFLPAGKSPLVVANPPYYPVGVGRLSPDPAVARARHELACTLKDVLTSSRYLLPPGGYLAVVYPVSRLPELMRHLPENKLAPVVLRLVQPRCDEGASHALLLARKGTKGSLVVRPPLVTHLNEGGYGPWYRDLTGMVL